MQNIEEDTRPLRETARGIDREIRASVEPSYDYGYPSYTEPEPAAPPAAPAEPATPEVRSPEGAVARTAGEPEVLKAETGAGNGTDPGRPSATV